MKTQKRSPKGKGKIVPLQAKPIAKQKKTVKPRAEQGPPSQGVPTPVTHEMIARRAWSIWMAKGCPAGQDEMNWHQAELELRMQASQE